MSKALSELKLLTLLQSLKSGLSLVDNFLKQEYNSGFLSNSHLYQKPWSLIIGPENTGKSSVLQASDIPQSQTQQDDKDICKTWIFNQSIYLQTPGSLISNPNNIKYWHSIAKQLAKVRKHKPIDNIVIMLNLCDFINQTHKNRKKTCYNLVRSIKHLCQKNKTSIPVYINFSHIDRVSGFAEFFSEITQEQRDKAWGLLLNRVPTTKLEHHFDSEFTTLLEHMHQQLIPLLHRTRNLTKRAKINNFPLQIENMQHHFKYLIMQLSKLNATEPSKHGEAVFIRGIFFTSAIQQGNVIDFLSNAMTSHFALEPVKEHRITRKSKPYFIKELFNQIIPCDPIITQAIVKRNKQKKILRFIGYGSVCATSLLTLALMTQQFSLNMEKIASLNEQMNQYEHLQNTPTANSTLLETILPSMNRIADVQHKLSYQPIEDIQTLKLSFPYVKKLQKQTRQLFNQSVYSQLLPKLAKEIELSLIDPSLSNFEHYQALKAYLMLAQPHRMDVDYIAQWYSRHGEVQQYLPLLKFSLSTVTQAISLNSHLIEQARSQLKQLAKEELALLKLQDQSLLQKKANGPPELYTHSGFAENYTQTIEQITQDLLQGDWVLGRRSASMALLQDESSQQQLIHNIRKQYIAEYQAYWQSSLDQIQFTNIKELPLLIHRLDELINAPQSLTHKLNQLIINTKPIDTHDEIANIFNRSISEHFIHLRYLSDVDVYKLHRLLSELKLALEKIRNHTDSEQASFDYAQRRFSIKQAIDDPITDMLHRAQQFPQPIKQWLTQLAENAWRVITHQAQAHINQQWQQKILPVYHAQIANRYPLKKASTDDIQLSHFKQFFAQNGMLDQFFKQYLESFIDTNQAQWKLKQVDGEQIDLTEAVIENLERANIIRLMFFSQANNQPFIAFSLQAKHLASDIQHVALDINGQKSFNYHGSNSLHEFLWPANNSNEANSYLELQGTNDKVLSYHEPGVWGLFRLFDKLELTKLDNTQAFSFQIIEEGKTQVEYQLLTVNAINPFISGILDNFQLAEIITMPSSK